MVTLLSVIIIVILGSSFCSLTETVLLSVSEIRVKQWAQNKTSASLALLKIKKKMNRPIATVVILNNIFNIAGSIITGSLATNVLGDTWLGLFSGLLTFLIIIFGEILPKTVGQQYAEKLALLLALPVKYLTIILTPLVWIMEKITQPFSQGKALPTTNEAEIRLLTRIGRTEGVIEADEAEMINRVFHLNDLSASDLMTPRIIITYLKGDLSLGECQENIIKSEHTRMLVIQDSIDEVIGIALKQELLATIIEGKQEEKVANLARPAKFVPETIRADHLLKNFQEIRQHLMVVIDEYGGVSGIVTLEDVLEVLTGEIVDETDRIIDLQEIARKKRERLLISKGIDDINKYHNEELAVDNEI